MIDDPKDAAPPPPELAKVIDLQDFKARKDFEAWNKQFPFYDPYSPFDMYGFPKDEDDWED